MTSKPGLFTGGFQRLNTELKAVADIQKGARKGLIIAGGLQVTAETWTVALLVHHLGWPVVPDVVSGLRLERTSYTENEHTGELVVVHNFDRMLLSNSLFDYFRPDVVLQIGGRLTSKRLANFLEQCFPRAYIVGEDHNFRQDPSHILTHRLQCPPVEFSSMIKEALSAGNATAYVAERLQELSKMELKKTRKVQQNFNVLAKALCFLSIGCGESLWEEVGNSSVPIGCAVGKLDPKFVNIGARNARHIVHGPPLLEQTMKTRTMLGLQEMVRR